MCECMCVYICVQISLCKGLSVEWLHDELDRVSVCVSVCVCVHVCTDISV